MRRIFQLTALVVLALWLPTTVHCSLETLFGGQADECCSEQGTDATAPVDHCVVENGGYRISDASVTVAAPAVLIGWGGRAVRVRQQVEAPKPAPGFLESPPELARTWQFTARTALPARAPSPVS